MAPKKKGSGDENDTFEIFQRCYKKAAREFEVLPDCERIMKPIYNRIDEKGDDFKQGWNFTDEFNQMAFRVIMLGLRQSGHNEIKALRLWRCGGGDEAARSVCVYLDAKPPPAVQELQMVDIGLTALAGEFLGKTLSVGGNPNLLYLRLDFNCIGDLGMERIAHGLSLNGTLRKLSAQYCGIGFSGASALGRALMFVNSQVADVNLRGNELGREGVIEFLRGCRRAKALKSLDLSGNKFGETEDVINAFQYLFQHNTSIESYTLLDNAFSDAGAQQLLAGILGNSHLQKVVVSERVPLATHEAIAIAVGGKKKGKKKKK
uniref:Uncharacterized protein n=1 Tax=Chromera velia CCMP2878 TaxID=1169474 RepID=A0A0G4FQS4_9ALVE|eukprot:Cvel_18270.t1-p1 / transcript=Cvel_18270.t1 / gene=Cvel_18270 / organism=Chromera_velia_CCMP2878 / gene_product=Protein NLRC3, putative / transcript_product=Protein NLRC3, putative / location=Cvel_scaffold1505:6894-10327(-) / protein_length=318 / sequence_SO=supercontig / SO=protein_coding / is_pseudo=false